MTEGNVAPTEETRRRAESFQRVVEDSLARNLSSDEFLAKLQEAGATSEEAVDYVEEFSQRRALTGANVVEGQTNRERTPEGLSDEDRVSFRKTRDSQAQTNLDPDHILTEANWQLLGAKLTHASSASDWQHSLSTNDFLKLLGGRELTPREIPSSVLDGAPHLRDLSAKSGRDPHLEDTWRLRTLYTSSKDTLEPIINLMQTQPLDQPLPRSIWKLIIQDQYVSFEKLLAATDVGYDHNDEAKDFGNGFALVKKDHTTAKKPLRGEADWTRIFNAWRDGTIMLYPHRREELQGYAKVVRDIFRASPSDPQNAIRFDVESRQRYANAPFRLDDRSESMVSILSQLFRGSKRGADTGTSPRLGKKQAATCYNWNLGICDDPCDYGRKHGICSECRGPHHAKELSTCDSAFQARHGKGPRHDNQESNRSTGNWSKAT